MRAVMIRNARGQHMRGGSLIDRDIGESHPVNVIARCPVGFGSPRYFSQYFKKMFGVTPSAYGKRGGGGESEKIEE